MCDFWCWYFFSPSVTTPTLINTVFSGLINRTVFPIPLVLFSQGRIGNSEMDPVSCWVEVFTGKLHPGEYCAYSLTPGLAAKVQIWSVITVGV